MHANVQRHAMAISHVIAVQCGVQCHIRPCAHMIGLEVSALRSPDRMYNAYYVSIKHAAQVAMWATLGWWRQYPCKFATGLGRPDHTKRSHQMSGAWSFDAKGDSVPKRTETIICWTAYRKRLLASCSDAQKSIWMGVSRSALTARSISSACSSRLFLARLHWEEDRNVHAVCA